MNKIKKLLKSDDSILVFDVDGVLALLEFGEYNHYELDDDIWTKLNEAGENFYTKDKVSKKMQEFLKTRNMNNVYVVTTVLSSNEAMFKKHYLKEYYNILEQNIKVVKKDSDKVNELIKIKTFYPTLEDYKLIMIDDTSKILTDIMLKTNFSTAHISSFLDI